MSGARTVRFGGNSDGSGGSDSGIESAGHGASHGGPARPDSNLTPAPPPVPLSSQHIPDKPAYPRTISFGSDVGRRHRSGETDSVIGPIVDQASHRNTADPDLFTTIEAQRFEIRALREALDGAEEKASHYKRRAERIDAELSQTGKDLRETQALWRGLFDRTEQLEDESKRHVLEKRELMEMLQNIPHDNEDLKMKIADAIHTIKKQSPEPKSSSRSKKADAKREKERLARRFERSDDTVSEPVLLSRPPRRRRDTYVEPWGLGNPPQKAPSSVEYASTTLRPVMTATPKNYGALPTQQQATHEDGYYEDGNYHSYSLPERPMRNTSTKSGHDEVKQNPETKPRSLVEAEAGSASEIRDEESDLSNIGVEPEQKHSTQHTETNQSPKTSKPSHREALDTTFEQITSTNAKLKEENEALRTALREALTHSLREALCSTMTSYKIRHATTKVESADELKRRFADLLPKLTHSNNATTVT